MHSSEFIAGGFLSFVAHNNNQIYCLIFFSFLFISETEATSLLLLRSIEQCEANKLLLNPFLYRFTFVHRSSYICLLVACACLQFKMPITIIVD